MKKYEVVFVLKADQPESEMAACVERVRAVVAENQGEITEEHPWGLRRLAYPIEHETQGNYMLLRYRCEGDANTPLDTMLRQDHLILRHLIVVDEEWQARNEANMARRRAKSKTALRPTPEASENSDDD